MIIIEISVKIPTNCKANRQIKNKPNNDFKTKVIEENFIISNYKSPLEFCWRLIIYDRNLVLRDYRCRLMDFKKTKYALNDVEYVSLKKQRKR